MTTPLSPIRNPVPVQVLDELRDTQYECISFEQLSSRPANYVYRGYLKIPLQLPSTNTIITSIIIKHALSDDTLYSSSERSAFDRSLAQQLSGTLSVPTFKQISVQSPGVYGHLKNSNTQIWHDVRNGRMFKGVIFSPDNLISPKHRESAGFQLGRWLRAFHNWASAPEQAGLRAKVPPRDPMRRVKWNISFGCFIDVLAKQPDVIAGHTHTLQAIQDTMAAEFAIPYDELDDDWGLVQGDLWLGNVLLAGSKWNDLPGEANNLWVIDFEYCQILHRSVDLGQALGDMYERKAYRNTEDGLSVMKGLIHGYGPISEDMAFRTVMYVGIYVINRSKHQPSQGPKAGSEKDKVAALAHGRDILLRAWMRDKAFFSDGVFANLFPLDSAQQTK